MLRVPDGGACKWILLLSGGPLNVAALTQRLTKTRAAAKGPATTYGESLALGSAEDGTVGSRLSPVE